MGREDCGALPWSLPEEAKWTYSLPSFGRVNFAQLNWNGTISGGRGWWFSLKLALFSSQKYSWSKHGPPHFPAFSICHSHSTYSQQCIKHTEWNATPINTIDEYIQKWGAHHAYFARVLPVNENAKWNKITHSGVECVSQLPRWMELNIAAIIGWVCDHW